MTTERLDRSARLPLLWAAPFLVLAFSAWPSASQQSSRGVERIAVETGSFDPESSAGLFVGIREFTGDSSLAEVPFAVDDAVDLAHLFSIELGLVSPKRVHVLISGRPKKDASEKRLEELKSAGAGISEGKATNSDIFRRVKKQSELAGAEGLLIVSFATHGVSVDGQHYLMAGESLRGYRETGVATATVFEDLDGSVATRRLVLLDACRERLENARGASRGPSMPEFLAESLGRSEGRIILSAARPDAFAYDDPERQNGVFTAEVMAGLRCSAPPDSRGLVTARSLGSYVDERVAEWIERNRGQVLASHRGIEMVGGGNFPLVHCPRPESSPDVVAEILSPIPGQNVVSADTLRARVYLSRAYAVVAVRPLRDGRFWIQNSPLETLSGDEVEIPVYYGGKDRYRVYLALTSDPDLFVRGKALDRRPFEDSSGQPVHWIGPVSVNPR